MRKIIKKITIILLIIILLNITFKSHKVYAILYGWCETDGQATINGGGGSSGSGSGGGGSGGGSDGGSGGGYQGCPGVGRFVYCNINYERSEEDVKLEENLYDTKGNYIGSALTLKDKYALVSGRFVGIDAYEEYKKTFYVTMNPVCREGRMVPVTVHHYKICYDARSGYETLYDSYDCSWDETYWVLECGTCSVSNCDCRGEADAKLNELANSVDLSPSYEGKRQDVNDINKGINENKDPNINVKWNEEFSTTEIGPSQPANCNSSTAWKTVTMTYTYNLTPAWIDPVTGKVKYESDCGETGKCVTEEDKNSYLKVPEMYITRKGKRIRIGQYFVPLNAKSTDLLKYHLKPNMSRAALSEAMCLALIDKYSIKTIAGEYWADFLGFKDSGEPMYPLIQTAEGARRQVQSDHGCRMGLYVAFKVKQDYYKENNNKIEGYNYYYRPIDYTKPFPNGMKKNGYWYNVYEHKSNTTNVYNSLGEKDTLNSIDLDDSFKRVTYKTNNSYSEKTIRNYNSSLGPMKDNRVYNSWLEMNTNGSSSFITGNNGVSRNGCQSFYNLGCGPANIDWKQCKITEVCR